MIRREYSLRRVGYWRKKRRVLKRNRRMRK
jgi:hypothetical protein